MDRKKASKIAWGCIGFWSIVILVCIAMPGPAFPQEIYFNPERRVGTDQVDKIEYAAWSWNETAGFRAEYAGETDQRCIEGAITVRTPTVDEWLSTGRSLFFNGAIAVDECDAGENGYQIVVSPVFQLDVRTYMHELGHTLGAWVHSSDDGDVMRGSIKTKGGISWQDVQLAIDEPFWNLYALPDVCFTQFLPDWNLYHANVDGTAFTLLYQGQVDGWHTWAAGDAYSVPGTPPACSDVTIDGQGGIVLQDVRSESAGHWRATLQHAGANTWRLVSAIPI